MNAQTKMFLTFVLATLATNFLLFTIPFTRDLILDSVAEGTEKVIKEKLGL